MVTFINILIGLILLFALIGLVSTILFFRNLKSRIRDRLEKKKSESKIREAPVQVKKRNIQINYTDVYGEKTSREINTIAFYPNSNLLRAFCMLRMDVRTFRIDRIAKAVEVDSGEPIDNVFGYLESIRRGS